MYSKQKHRKENVGEEYKHDLVDVVNGAVFDDEKHGAVNLKRKVDNEYHKGYKEHRLSRIGTKIKQRGREFCATLAYDRLHNCVYRKSHTEVNYHRRKGRKQGKEQRLKRVKHSVYVLKIKEGNEYHEAREGNTSRGLYNLAPSAAAPYHYRRRHNGNCKKYKPLEEI